MKIGIVGYGHVGKAMFELFKDAEVYDKFLGMGAQEELNLCDTVFICVPTPPKSNGECEAQGTASHRDLHRYAKPLPRSDCGGKGANPGGGTPSLCKNTHLRTGPIDTHRS